MSPTQAVVLAVVQAVTEFLPISSSGHLILIPYFLGWKDQGLSFDIAVHTGTLLAILLYFRRDVRDLLSGFLTGQAVSADGSYAPRPLAWWILLGTLPAGLVGLAIKDWVEREARSPLLIAGTTLGYGLLLFVADRLGRRERELGDLGWRDALLIGAAQALALVPGTSRSGVTLTAALFLGFSRPAGARFTFLLIIPISVMVAGLDAFDLARAGVTLDELTPMALGLAVSAVVGYLVIAWLLAWLRRRPVTVFVVYRLLLAAVILVTAALRNS